MHIGVVKSYCIRTCDVIVKGQLKFQPLVLWTGGSITYFLILGKGADFVPYMFSREKNGLGQQLNPWCALGFIAPRACRGKLLTQSTIVALGGLRASFPLAVNKAGFQSSWVIHYLIITITI